jgi:hypothetical protein
MISALFEQLLVPSRLEPLGLVDVLDWTGAVLNRIEDPAAFVEKFTEGHAVQYFYEPFLQEFDPELRKQLGVWYTPQEIVRYMVERVDTVLREELGVTEGLADENVYVLDPCCGTGAYLVEVLRRIERTMKERGEGATTGAQLKQAAMSRVVGVVSRAGGGQLKPAESEYALDANWGHVAPNGIMPGKGCAVERDYTEEERASVAEGAAALGLSEDEALRRLGEKTFDVYINEVGYWRNIPARVWGYYIGGYQVIKKWLSYREREVLGRDLSTAEVNEVRDMARRIAALLLLEPALDENYNSIKQNAYAWPVSA